MRRDVPFRDLLQYAIGGGWGQPASFVNSVPVRVIRGTDFGNIAAGNYGAIPSRFEEQTKAQRRLLRADDIILEISGGSRTSGQATGRTLLVTQRLLGMLGEQAIPASFCRLIRLKEEIVVPQFAFYALQEMYRSGRASRYEHHSTGISNFQFEFFLDQEVVRIPPLPEQRAIVHVLGALDNKIESNRRMAQTLEATAHALFRSWFVDFDQTSGAMPDGWQYGTISELADVVGGSTPSTKEPTFWHGGTHAWATPKDLAALRSPVLLDTERRITDAGLATISSGLLAPGTVLLSSRAPIGYLAIAEVPVAINQGFIAMKPRPGVPSLFLLLWAAAAHGEIVSRANGSTFLEISKANFRPIPVVLPPYGTLDAFDRLARPFHKRMVICVRESHTLTALRDALLPKLLSGELLVSDVERLAAAQA